MIRAPIALTAYAPVWSQQCSAEQSSLAAIFPPSEFSIEHIGSTSVPDLAADYALFKRELAARYGNDRDAYTDAKAPFLRSVIERASERRRFTVEPR